MAFLCHLHKYLHSEIAGAEVWKLGCYFYCKKVFNPMSNVQKYRWEIGFVSTFPMFRIMRSGTFHFLFNDLLSHQKIDDVEKKLCQNWRQLSFTFVFQTAVGSWLVIHFDSFRKKRKVIMDSPEKENTYCDLWDGTFNAMFHLANFVLGIGFRFVFWNV